MDANWLGKLSFKDHEKLEELTGHGIASIPDENPLAMMRVFATAWWLLQRKTRPDYTLEEALDEPAEAYMPGFGDDSVDPTG
ncbi:MAG: hypothetical protein OXI18_11695 [bacterium]|nr:hypothetical protein [bacterium]